MNAYSVSLNTFKNTLLLKGEYYFYILTFVSSFAIFVFITCLLLFYCLTNLFPEQILYIFLDMPSFFREVIYYICGTKLASVILLAHELLGDELETLQVFT